MNGVVPGYYMHTQRGCDEFGRTSQYDVALLWLFLKCSFPCEKCSVNHVHTQPCSFMCVDNSPVLVSRPTQSIKRRERHL